MPLPSTGDVIRLLAAVFVTGIVASPLMTSPLHWYGSYPLVYVWTWATLTAYRRRWATAGDLRARLAR